MIKYIQLQSKTDLNVLNISKFSPFKAVVIIEEDLEKGLNLEIFNTFRSVFDCNCIYFIILLCSLVFVSFFYFLYL